MTSQGYLRRSHERLHAALDELAARWALASRGKGCVRCPALGCLFSNHSILELMEWSAEQADVAIVATGGPADAILDGKENRPMSTTKKAPAKKK